MGLFSFFSKKTSVSSDVIIAADGGDEAAKQILGTAFEQGLTSEEHNKLRREAYYPLAINGDANAQYWMGFLAQNVDMNRDDALYWYEISAAQGNTKAMLGLAFGYSESINDSQNSYTGCIGFGFDAAKERFWRLEAAKNGDPKAQVDLASDFLSDGDTENALKMYQLAATTSDCKILMTAYDGLARIYGNPVDTKNYNTKMQKEYLIRILEMKQNNLNDIGAYNETYYASAAFNLGHIYLHDYEKTSESCLLKRYVYCFVLAHTMGYDYSKEIIDKSGYEFSGDELDEWQNHAKTLSFYLP